MVRRSTVTDIQSLVILICLVQLLITINNLASVNNTSSNEQSRSMLLDKRTASTSIRSITSSTSIDCPKVRQTQASSTAASPTINTSGNSSSSFSSMRTILQQLKGNQNEKFDRSRPLFIDIGMNNGHDTMHHLQQGFSVIAVDAFGPHVDKIKEQITPAHKDYHNLLVFNVGLSTSENEGSVMPLYYLRKGHPMASFNKAKACGMLGTKYMNRCQSSKVQVVNCLSVLEIGGKSADYLKIDIEMMHHVCLQALHSLPSLLLPKIVCWEDHDKPFGTARVPAPVTDMKLILSLWELGYDGVKIIGQGPVAMELYGKRYDVGNGQKSSKLTPDQQLHLDPWTQNYDTQWKTIDYILHQGIMPKHNLTGSTYPGLYYDICMKLADDAESLRDVRHQKENQPISGAYNS
mmetsp:Transcript_22705/g.37568  ORF Transcript_22705/g.37568 Transcript_22705/m.37568 type:complete len:406 (+) Transcript_22705:122-1339(+)|eukprot:CAMPEP_0119015684 /NCGR_PEP_ID=MMETSP1176-20130426/11406_1 /TAXON_ID=265551 /ORGANISM="Synedropsis recta cf, Strain CCMP1620" /LENGTH=405 /DNA_ID=CAMNT_0006968997 /DNA_START=106 /DNA_END=1323 /DNA_ORIENTATION=+